MCGSLARIAHARGEALFFSLTAYPVDRTGIHKLPGHYVSCVASLYFHSTAWLCCSFWVFAFAGCAVFVWLVLFLVFLVFAFFVPCGMTSYDLTPRV